MMRAVQLQRSRVTAAPLRNLKEILKGDRAPEKSKIFLDGGGARQRVNVFLGKEKRSKANFAPTGRRPVFFILFGLIKQDRAPSLRLQPFQSRQCLHPLRSYPHDRTS